MALVKIIYTSMIGNIKEIANIVGNRFEELGHTIEADECTAVDTANFEDASIATIASCTYGGGELPDKIADFYEDLADVDLSDKIFGVIGSGDTLYNYFCKAVDEFEAQFVLAGVTEGADSIKTDLLADDEDIQELEAFVETISEEVN